MIEPQSAVAVVKVSVFALLIWLGAEPEAEFQSAAAVATLA
jgi:hypothetical protein